MRQTIKTRNSWSVTHIVSENKITKISEYLLRDVIPIRSNYLMTKPWIRRQHDTFVFQYCWVSAPFLRYIGPGKVIRCHIGSDTQCDHVWLPINLLRDTRRKVAARSVNHVYEPFIRPIGRSASLSLSRVCEWAIGLRLTMTPSPTQCGCLSEAAMADIVECAAKDRHRLDDAWRNLVGLGLQMSRSYCGLNSSVRARGGWAEFSTISGHSVGHFGGCVKRMGELKGVNGTEGIEGNWKSGKRWKRYSWNGQTIESKRVASKERQTGRNSRVLQSAKAKEGRVSRIAPFTEHRAGHFGGGPGSVSLSAPSTLSSHHAYNRKAIDSINSLRGARRTLFFLFLEADMRHRLSKNHALEHGQGHSFMTAIAPNVMIQRWRYTTSI